MAEIIFKAENIVKKYKKKRGFFALNGLDMEICRGDIYGFVGENGAGKTTLLRILSGRAAQTSGNITLLGESSRKGLCQTKCVFCQTCSVLRRTAYTYYTTPVYFKRRRSSEEWFRYGGG